MVLGFCLCGGKGERVPTSYMHKDYTTTRHIQHTIGLDDKQEHIILGEPNEMNEYFVMSVCMEKWSRYYKKKVYITWAQENKLLRWHNLWSEHQRQTYIKCYFFSSEASFLVLLYTKATYFRLFILLYVCIFPFSFVRFYHSHFILAYNWCISSQLFIFSTFVLWKKGSYWYEL